MLLQLGQSGELSWGFKLLPWLQPRLVVAALEGRYGNELVMAFLVLVLSSPLVLTGVWTDQEPTANFSPPPKLSRPPTTTATFTIYILSCLSSNL